MRVWLGIPELSTLNIRLWRDSWTVTVGSSKIAERNGHAAMHLQSGTGQRSQVERNRRRIRVMKQDFCTQRLKTNKTKKNRKKKEKIFSLFVTKHLKCEKERKSLQNLNIIHIPLLRWHRVTLVSWLSWDNDPSVALQSAEMHDSVVVRGCSTHTSVTHAAGSARTGPCSATIYCNPSTA